LIRKLLSHFHHWELVLVAVLKPLGFWGVAVLGAIDAGSIAIPMDPIIGVYAWNDRAHFWVYAIMGALGAAVGALVPFYIGRAGGELVLAKHMDSYTYEKMRARFDRHHWFAVLVPAALPPPFPFKLFAFGAGVFEMRVLPYMTAVFVGRTLHYLVTALLVVLYGPEIMNLILHGAKRHKPLMLLAALILTVGFLIYVFRLRRQKRRQAAPPVDES
jgi:membrane protein YqaA with SNARE-associated domain